MGIQPITARILMGQAKEKHKILVTSKHWEAPNTTEEHSLLAWQEISAGCLPPTHQQRHNFLFVPGCKHFDIFCQECKFNYNNIKQESMAMSADVVGGDGDDAKDYASPTDPPTKTTILWSRLTAPFSC